MIVMKFGGTSTQDAQAVTNVVKIVQARLSKKPIVVISAISQATNMLEKIGKLAAEKNDRDAREILTQLFNRHYAIVDQIVRHITRNRALRNILEKSREEIETTIKGISILHELTPRTLDSLYCYGELLSSRVVAAAFQEHGVPSEWIDTKEFMITDDHYTHAIPSFELIERKLKLLALPIIEKGIVPVTQGFIGITPSGNRTTMGRESSDYSAAIIGAALDVDDIQIWTDVDGVLTADPAIVSDPKKIKALSFEEAYELSYFGAKVLHPNTMLPAIEKSIPIHIYNSRHGHSSGTLVSTPREEKYSIVKSDAYKRNMVVLNIRPVKRLGQYTFWENIHNVLIKHDISVKITVTSEYGYSVVIDARDYIPTLVYDLSEIGKVDVSEGMGIVCLVGSNLKSAANIINRIFNAISDYEVNLISFGGSKSNLSFVVDDNEIPEIVSRLHEEFFKDIGTDDMFELIEHN